MKKCGMRDSREKGAGMRDQDPPFQTLYLDTFLLLTTSFL